MSKKPVIFLTFANDEDAYLDNLQKERKDIRRLLWPLHEKEAIEFYGEPSTTIKDIFENFNLFKGRINIFHYAGHASGKSLQLEDQEADAQGLARLLGQQEELKLVFLNGCSTLDQVDLLLGQGVKSVIATSVPIDDNMAVEFAVQFYQALVSGASLENAYNRGIAYLETTYQDNISSRGISFRKIDWEAGAEVDSEKIPWGLYVKKTEQEVLNWKLPELKSVKLPDNMGKAIAENYKVNQYLPEIIFEMAKYSKSIQKALTEEDDFGDPLLDKREYPEYIIKNFPWPISAQLRILIANSEEMNSVGLPRLHQILHTYFIASKCLCYFLLSQLWDEARGVRLKIDKELVNLFSFDKSVKDTFDFMPVIHKISVAFGENDIPFFVEEFKDIKESIEKEDEVYTAYSYLETIQDKITAGELSNEEAKTLCNECEYCLTVFLKRIAFLAKYRLVTVKDISYIKARHQEALYRIQLGVLNTINQDLLKADARDNSNATDTHSVLLVKSLKNMNEYLNVSPFIVDKNAFLGKPIPNIYMFNYLDLDKRYHYVSVSYNILQKEPEPADVFHSQGEEFGLIQSQFEAISTELKTYQINN